MDDQMARERAAAAAENLPFHRYFRTCHGSWHTPLTYNSTLLRSLRLPTWLGFRMETSLDYETSGAHGQVIHTTRVAWRFVPLLATVETFSLGDDGQSFAMVGRMTLPLFWGPRIYGGGGRVDADGAGCAYTFEGGWMGLWSVLSQKTRLSGDQDELTVEQNHRLFRGVQHLRRRA